MSINGEKGVKMAEKLTDFVNGASLQEKQAFVQYMLREHRHLQQEVFNLMLGTIEGWSKLVGTSFYDQRNQHAVHTSNAIIQFLNSNRG